MHEDAVESLIEEVASEAQERLRQEPHTGADRLGHVEVVADQPLERRNEHHEPGTHIRD